MPHAVIVAEPARSEDRRTAVGVLTGWAGEHGGLAGEHGRTVVMLIPDADPHAAACEAAHRAGRAGCTVTVGAAGRSGGPAAIRDAHREARQCADVLTALGRVGRIATPEDLGDGLPEGQWRLTGGSLGSMRGRNFAPSDAPARTVATAGPPGTSGH